jgi:hypothetical protein
MNLYQRIALANPPAAKAVIQNFGYEIRTNNLPQALRMLVANEGEEALRAIVDIHPDKDLILECYEEKMSGKKEEDCKCKDKHNHSHKNEMDVMYANATGQLTEAQKQAHLTTTFLIAASILILGALLIKNK